MFYYNLTRNLLDLNDKYPEISTLYTSKDVQRYFKLPLTLSSYNSSHILSIMRVPMIHPDSTFNQDSEKFFDGFVVLSNLYYNMYLTFPQYANCIDDSKHYETVCFLRPCLVRYSVSMWSCKCMVTIYRAEKIGFKCYALSKTDFLISSSNSKVNIIN